MDIQVKKIDDQTIQVISTADPVVTTVTYDIDFLNKQLIAIQAQQDEQNAAREAEKAIINNLLMQAKSIGISATIIT